MSSGRTCPAHSAIVGPLPTAATAYARIKVALTRSHPHDGEAYYDVKDPVCDLIMDAAECWATDVLGRPTDEASQHIGHERTVGGR